MFVFKGIPPPTSKTMLPLAREHSFHISACCPKVLQNCSKWHSFGALWPQNGPKVPQRSLPKNKKTLRFLLPPGLQNDSKITSKMIDCFWDRRFLGGSGCRLPPKCPPEGQKTPKSQEVTSKYTGNHQKYDLAEWMVAVIFMVNSTWHRRPYRTMPTKTT